MWLLLRAFSKSRRYNLDDKVRAALAAAGWGIVPLYVGQQTQPESQMGGMRAPGSSVYLDLENGPPLTQLCATPPEMDTSAPTPGSSVRIALDLDLNTALTRDPGAPEPALAVI